MHAYNLREVTDTTFMEQAIMWSSFGRPTTDTNETQTQGRAAVKR